MPPHSGADGHPGSRCRRILKSDPLASRWPERRGQIGNLRVANNSQTCGALAGQPMSVPAAVTPSARSSCCAFQPTLSPAALRTSVWKILDTVPPPLARLHGQIARLRAGQRPVPAQCRRRSIRRRASATSGSLVENYTTLPRARWHEMLRRYLSQGKKHPYHHYGQPRPPALPSLLQNTKTLMELWAASRKDRSDQTQVARSRSRSRLVSAQLGFDRAGQAIRNGHLPDRLDHVESCHF